MAVLDHTCKKYCFSEQFFLLLLLKNSNISASFSGPAVLDHRGVLWWEPVFCIRSMASALISTSLGLLLFHNFWSSLQSSLFVLCVLKKHSFFPAWEEETI